MRRSAAAFAFSAFVLAFVCSALVDNALDAMAGGPGTVRVEAAIAAGEFVLTVSDDGPGIDEAIAPRIFEPFFSTRDSKAHSGLGLAAARGVARSLGGDIAYEHPVQGGCRFIARDWDTKLPPDEAAARVKAPIGWPDLATGASAARGHAQ